MATYATLTVPVRDIIGADFNASRASVWIEPNVPVVLADSIRVGGRREQVVNGVATFANLVTTNSADNPTSFGYRVTITAPPKGAQKREDIVVLTTSDFPFTATANLKDIDEAWDHVVIPAEWRSEFRDEMEAHEAATSGDRAAVAADRAYVEARVVDDLGTTDGQTKALVDTPSSLTAQALSATYAANGKPTTTASKGQTLEVAFTQDADYEEQWQTVANAGGGAGTYNNGYWRGFNVGRHTNQPVETGKPSWIVGVESNYFDAPGSGKFGPEWYVEYWSANNHWQMFRPFYTRVEHDTTTNKIAASTHLDIGDSPDGAFTILSDLNHKTPAAAKLFEITNTSTTVYQQLNVTGNLTVNKTSAAQFSLISGSGQSIATLDSPSPPVLLFKVGGANAWYHLANDVNTMSILDKAGTDFVKYVYSSFGTFGRRAEFKSSVYIDGGLAIGPTALPTNATDGFLYIPTITGGAPTGVPTAQNASTPIAWDPANNKLWVRSGGAWKSVTFA